MIEIEQRKNHRLVDIGEDRYWLKDPVVENVVCVEAFGRRRELFSWLSANPTGNDLERVDV